MQTSDLFEAYSPSPVKVTSGGDFRLLRLRSMRDWDAADHLSPFSRERLGLSLASVTVDDKSKKEATTLFFRVVQSPSGKVLYESSKFKCGQSLSLPTVWLERDRPGETAPPPRPSSPGPVMLTASSSTEQMLLRVATDDAAQRFASPLRSDGSELLLELRKQGLLRSKRVAAIVLDTGGGSEAFDRPLCVQHTVQQSGASPAVTVQLRLLRSISAETRPLDAPVYNPLLTRYLIDTTAPLHTAFKAGDVLLFSGTGLWASELKLAANSPFTQAALVVRLPHPYSCIERSYLLTATRNHAGLADAFSRTARSGVCLFDVEDALFDFYGDCVVHLLRAQPLTADEQARLVHHVWSMHSSAAPFAAMALPHLQRQALASVAAQCGYNPRKDVVFEAYSTQLVASALHEALPASDGTAAVDLPADFLRSAAYLAPVTLREQRHSPYSTASPALPASSSPATAPSSSRYETYSAARDPFSFRGTVRAHEGGGGFLPSLLDAFRRPDDDDDNNNHDDHRHNDDRTAMTSSEPVIPTTATRQRGERSGSFSLTDALLPSLRSQDLFSCVLSTDGSSALGGQVERLSFFTRVFLWATQHELSSYVPATAQQCELPRCPPHQAVRVTALPFGGVRLPIEDEDFPGSRLTAKLFFGLLSSVLVPIDDSCSDGCVSAQSLPFYRQLPACNNHWPELTSDAAMSRLAFAGFVAWRVRRYSHADVAGAEWVADFSHLGVLPVRAGFERYGATAWFDGKQRPVCIHWCHADRRVRPGDDDWPHAKFVWRCSAFLSVTVGDHLVTTHLLVSNAVTHAARTSFVCSHPLRRLVKPFSFRTAQVNYAATFTLVPERGIIHRSWALTYDGVTAALRLAVDQAVTAPFPQLFAALGLRLDSDDDNDNHPWMTDAMRVYLVVRQFVADYVAVYYDPASLLDDAQIVDFFDNVRAHVPTLHTPSPLTYDAFVDFFASFVWTVVGLHEGVGSVVEYLLDPTFIAAKIRPGANTADLDSFLQIVCLVAQTGTRNPSLLDDFGHLFTDEPGRLCFVKFQNNLRALSAQLAAANATRKWPCRTWDPVLFECSVSV